MYYVKEEDIGLAGMALVDSMSVVDEMVLKYESKQCIFITVVRENSELPAGVNSISVEEQIPISEVRVHVVYSVDEGGVIFQTQQSQVDSEYLYQCTQQSNTTSLAKGKEIAPADSCYVSENRVADIWDDDTAGTEDEDEDVSGGSVDEEDGSEAEVCFYNGESRPAENERKRRADEAELNEMIINLKKKKMLISDNDSENEELFVLSDTSSDDCMPIQTLKKLPVKRGPTTRSHCSQASKPLPDYIPDEGFVEEEDSDDCFPELAHILPCGRKTRAKKMQARLWYDEGRASPEEQICLKLCFTDVYQFRRALKQMHIAQLRNYKLHRNYKDRVIAKCKHSPETQMN